MSVRPAVSRAFKRDGEQYYVIVAGCSRSTRRHRPDNQRRFVRARDEGMVQLSNSRDVREGGAPPR